VNKREYESKKERKRKYREGGEKMVGSAGFEPAICGARLCLATVPVSTKGISFLLQLPRVVI
jgi:hypothetical protein